MSKARQVKRTSFLYSKKLGELAERFHSLVLNKNIERMSDEYNHLVKKFDEEWRRWCSFQKGNRIISPNPDGFSKYIKKV